MKISNPGYLGLRAVLFAAAVTLSSCNSLIYDGEGDCTSHNSATFRYEANVLKSDAFGRMVTGVNLYVFHKDGSPAGIYRQTRESSADNDFRLPLDLPPGEYDMVAWCTGAAASPRPVGFEITDKPTVIADLSATLPLSVGSDGKLRSSSDITPLFHGMATGIRITDAPGEAVLDPIYLIKDTNRINIILQNLDGTPMSPGEYIFEITGSGDRLDCRNNVVPSSPFTFGSWETLQTSAALVKSDDAGAGIMARLTTSRLMTDIEQTVNISLASTGETVISFPLIEYLLMIKDNYSVFNSVQEYLDGVDEFTFNLFMDKGNIWAKTRILINGWRVVPDQGVEM